MLVVEQLNVFTDEFHCIGCVPEINTLEEATEENLLKSFISKMSKKDQFSLRKEENSIYLTFKDMEKPKYRFFNFDEYEVKE